MGLIQIDLGNYAAAVNAFTHALTYSDGNPVQVYENLGGLTLVYGTPENDDHFFGIALKASPDNTTLWTELATYTDEHGDDANAKVYIEKAAMYGPVSSPIYRGIESGKPFVVKYAYRYITI
jgi:Tfp pilus assembly protein PilF